MADGTHIEWTDATWNPVTGCSVVSPGCTNCYAMRLAGTRLQHHPSRAGLTIDTKAGPVWNGQVRLNEDWFDQPLRWRRRRRIFVCAHGDLFHESVPDAWIDRVFAVMALAPQHTFQVLTKRSSRMRAYLSDPATFDRVVEFMFALVGEGVPPARVTCERHGMAWKQPTCAEDWWPLRNVWLGVSAEDQVRADERVPDLLATPAAVRFLSAEPLLGPLDLKPWLGEEDGCEDCDDNYPSLPRCAQYGTPRADQCPRLRAAWNTLEGPIAADGAPEWMRVDRVVLDWIIAGGESGLGARPMHPAWVRQLRDDCATAGTAFFFKQWGAWLPWLQFNEAAVVDEGEFSRFAALIWREEQRRWDDFDPLDELGAEGPEGLNQIVGHVGKTAAGRELDGLTHSAFPEARP